MLKLLSKISPTFLGYRKERIKDFFKCYGVKWGSKCMHINTLFHWPKLPNSFFKVIEIFSNNIPNLCGGNLKHVGGGNLGQSLNIYYYFQKKRNIFQKWQLFFSIIKLKSYTLFLSHVQNCPISIFLCQLQCEGAGHWWNQFWRVWKLMKNMDPWDNFCFEL